jgi:hypothetical protein
MSKNKKQSQRNLASHRQGENEWPPLSDLEQEISWVCLRFFRGDWDLYLDYLGGTRVSTLQRSREFPLVEQLRERDRHTDYLAAMLEDEIIATAESLPFEDLYRLWEQTLILNPDADPFKDHPDQRREDTGVPPEPPTSLH